MNTSANPARYPAWLHISRLLLVLAVLAWTAITTVGVASADDDDDDDDDDDSTPSSVIATWPPATVDWPPQLESADDATSGAQPPIVMPSGQPLPLPTLMAHPFQPIVPVTITAVPGATPP